MSTIKNSQTATQIFTIPSTFGMPACGHAFGSGDAVAVQAEVRVKGDMAFGVNALAVRTYVPGTSAWSPPPS